MSTSSSVILNVVALAFYSLSAWVTLPTRYRNGNSNDDDDTANTSPSSSTCCCCCCCCCCSSSVGVVAIQSQHPPLSPASRSSLRRGVSPLCKSPNSARWPIPTRRISSRGSAWRPRAARAAPKCIASRICRGVSSAPCAVRTVSNGCIPWRLVSMNDNAKRKRFRRYRIHLRPLGTGFDAEYLPVSRPIASGESKDVRQRLHFVACPRWGR